MNFDAFEQLFVPFCVTPGVDSGKARSYYLAIKYLAEFLNLPNFDDQNARIILQKESEITDPSCNFYRQLQLWLEPRHQKSYLTKGYIQAALRYFRPCAANYHLL